MIEDLTFTDKMYLFSEEVTSNYSKHPLSVKYQYKGFFGRHGPIYINTPDKGFLLKSEGSRLLEIPIIYKLHEFSEEYRTLPNSYENKYDDLFVIKSIDKNILELFKEKMSISPLNNFLKSKNIKPRYFYFLNGWPLTSKLWSMMHDREFIELK